MIPDPKVRVVAIDGEIVPPEQAAVSVYDRGFLYGDAVFEVLRTYAGVPFALAEHVARLRRSANLCLIDMPLDDAAFADEITRVIKARAHRDPDNLESYARIMLTRGSGPLGLDPDLGGAPLRVILAEPVVPPARVAYEKGVALATVATRRTVDETSAQGAKVSNYLANLLALREAKGKGAAEALIVDSRGDVVEGASSNVFIVKGGRLVTPPESAGILVGITRACILEEAARLGIPIQERTIVAEDLYTANEVFITSSIRELLPAVVIDGRKIGAGVPGEVTRRLHRAFRDRVGLDGAPMPWE
jgi:branched-chain amino acid aminotransferase